MTTSLLFRDDAYLREATARIVAVNELGGIVLDRTPFYATGGGQPGDSGLLTIPGGASLAIATAVKGRAEDGGPDTVVHVPAEGAGTLPVGATVTAAIDWARRHRLMRVHTCLHLLSAVLPFPVTGGQVGDGKGRLDFAMDGEIPDREAAEARLNELVAADHAVGSEWIDDAELARRPELVKTMSVKPPAGAGQVRLVRIAGLDLQPCGGTHVARTGEIGRVALGRIESKGRQNRRVAIALLEP
ncbi:MAG: alanyl-tRNA editing protein [Alphaproteobacteria bacterium]|nr:alanyl-tRNA editing protein [Alphaproteobacteria bacterium]